MGSAMPLSRFWISFRCPVRGSRSTRTCCGGGGGSSICPAPILHPPPDSSHCPGTGLTGPTDTAPQCGWIPPTRDQPQPPNHVPMVPSTNGSCPPRYLVLDLLRRCRRWAPGGGRGGVPVALPRDREGGEAQGGDGGREEQLPRGPASLPPQLAGDAGDRDDLGTGREGQGGPQGWGGSRWGAGAHLAEHGLALGVRHRIRRPVNRQPDGPGQAAAQGVVEGDGELGDRGTRRQLRRDPVPPARPSTRPPGVLTRPAASVRGQMLMLRASQKTKFSLVPPRLPRALATRTCRDGPRSRHEVGGAHPVPPHTPPVPPRRAPGPTWQLPQPAASCRA